MDNKLLDTCRYTGIKVTEENSADFTVCSDCTGLTKTSELQNRECRCSYCGKQLV